jgi:hypothetical protein
MVEFCIRRNAIWGDLRTLCGSGNENTLYRQDLQDCSLWRYNAETSEPGKIVFSGDAYFCKHCMRIFIRQGLLEFDDF